MGFSQAEFGHLLTNEKGEIIPPINWTKEWKESYLSGHPGAIIAE